MFDYEIYDSSKNYYYEMVNKDGKYFQHEYRIDSDGNVVHERWMEAKYIIGSGTNLRMYFYDESGMFGLVKPDPADFQLISKFEVPMGSDQHWAHPVVSNGRLFVRHGNALMVYDIASK